MSLTKPNAELLKYNPSGTGAVQRTVAGKLAESVSVKDFGAVGDGVTDDTAAFNAALLVSDRVFVPTGVYVVNNVTGVKSNTELFGSGWGSVLKQISNAGVNDHILDIRHNASGGSASTSNNFQNIRIRDLQVRGPNNIPTFNEHCHLIAMCAVSEVTIENVYFYAFKGDGLYVGSGDTPNVERHNARVTVRKCLFDGVNKANRNAISIIDCDTVLIEDSVFQNTTASNMPGAIDIEPDNYSWHTVFNVTIRNNRFNNCKAGIVVFVPDYFTYPARGFYIESNYINICDTGIAIETSNASAPGGLVSDSSVDTDMHIANNHVVSCVTPISVVGVKRCFIEKNLFEDCTYNAVFGNSAVDRLKSRDVFIIENKFARCGSTSSYGCRIDGVTNLQIMGNRFVDCGDGALPSSAIDFNIVTPNSVSGIEFIGNSITTPTGKTLSAVTQTGSTSFSFDRARIYGNQFSGLASIFAESRGYVTKSVVVGDSGGSPYDMVIDLPPATNSGNVTQIMAGWTHRGYSSHYAQYIGVVLRGDGGASQVLSVSQTGSSGHSISVQTVTTTSVTLRLTYSFNGTFSATVFG